MRISLVFNCNHFNLESIFFTFEVEVFLILFMYASYYTKVATAPEIGGAGCCVLYLYADVVRAEALEGCAVQSFLMVRMGDADEQFCTLLH